MSLFLDNRILSKSIISAVGTGTYTITILDLLGDVNEDVRLASIKSLMWSTDSMITIKRGSEVLIDLVGNGDMRLSEIRHVLSEYSSQDIIIEIPSGGSVFLEVTKQFVVPLLFYYTVLLSPHRQPLDNIIALENGDEPLFDIILDYPLQN